MLIATALAIKSSSDKVPAMLHCLWWSGTYLHVDSIAPTDYTPAKIDLHYSIFFS